MFRPNTARPPISTGGESSPAIDAAPLARGGPSPLGLYLPQLAVPTAAFERIPVPAGLRFNGQAAWYKFGQYAPNDEQEINVSGLHFQIRPCDVDNVGDATVAAADATSWGDEDGLGACIVVGVNLPGELWTWTAAPAAFAGLRLSDLGTQPSPRYIAKQYFPCGKRGDAPAWGKDVPRAFGVNVVRIGKNNTLDVALVVNPTLGAQPLENALVARTLCGFASVDIHAGTVQVGVPFTTAAD